MSNHNYSGELVSYAAGVRYHAASMLIWNVTNKAEMASCWCTLRARTHVAGTASISESNCTINVIVIIDYVQLTAICKIY